MKTILRILALGILLAAWPATAAVQIYRTVTLTNSPNLTNGIQLTVNGDTRTGQDIVTNALTEWAHTNRIDKATTNLYLHLLARGFTNVTIQYAGGTNNILLVGGTNYTMPLSIFGAWASVSNYTSTVYSATAYMTPYGPFETDTFRIWQQNIVVSNLAYATAQYSAAVRALTNFLGAHLGSQWYTNKHFADGTLIRMALEAVQLGNSNFFNSASSRVYLPVPSGVNFLFDDGSGTVEEWNWNDGLYIPKDTNTTARLGYFHPEQFGFDPVTGTLWITNFAKLTNMFLQEPHLSGGTISNATRIYHAFMLNDAGAPHADAIDFTDADTNRQYYLSMNTSGRPSIYTDAGLAFLADDSIDDAEIITWRSLTNYTPSITLGKQNTWQSTNRFVGPTHITEGYISGTGLTNVTGSNWNARAVSLAQSFLGSSNTLNGELYLSAGTYASLASGAASTNVIQLATNTVTLVSGNSADASVQSMKDVAGTPDTPRLAITVNNTPYNLTFLDESGAETVPGRRFKLNGYNFQLTPYRHAIWWWASEHQRWELVAHSSQLTATATNVMLYTNQVATGNGMINLIPGAGITLIVTNIGGTNHVGISSTGGGSTNNAGFGVVNAGQFATNNNTLTRKDGGLGTNELEYNLVATSSGTPGRALFTLTNGTPGLTNDLFALLGTNGNVLMTINSNNTVQSWYSNGVFSHSWSNNNGVLALRVSNGVPVVTINGGNGAWTNSSAFRADAVSTVNGITSGAGLIIANGSAMGVTGGADIFASTTALLLRAPGSIFFDIDTDGNSTGERFVWGHDDGSFSGLVAMMTLTEAGWLGIGATNPLAQLHVTNTAAATDPVRVYTAVGNPALPAVTVSSNRLVQLGASAATNTPPAGHAAFFAATNSGAVEMFVIDSAGNLTQLSAHPGDAPPVFYITTNWVGGMPRINRTVKLYAGVIEWENQTLASLIDLWRTESELFSTNYFATLTNPQKTAIRMARHRLESFATYNARMGFTNGHPDRLIKLNWAAVQNQRQLDWNTLRTNELIAFNTPVLVPTVTNTVDGTNVIVVGYTNAVNTNIYVRADQNVREPKPALVDWDAPVAVAVAAPAAAPVTSLTPLPKRAGSKQGTKP